MKTTTTTLFLSAIMAVSAASQGYETFRKPPGWPVATPLPASSVWKPVPPAPQQVFVLPVRQTPIWLSNPKQTVHPAPACQTVVPVVVYQPSTIPAITVGQGLVLPSPLFRFRNQ